MKKYEFKVYIYIYYLFSAKFTIFVIVCFDKIHKIR
jgi:hypothetical protein